MDPESDKETGDMEAPPVGAPAEAVEREYAPLGAGDEPLPPPPLAPAAEVVLPVADELPAPPPAVAGGVPASAPPPPPPAPAAVEEVLAALMDEQPMVAVPAAVARWYADTLYLALLALTGAILGFLFVYDKGLSLTNAHGDMTAPQQLTALFLTVGDIASICLIFSPSGYFRGVWTEGAGPGLAPLMPPLAGLINCGVWFAYGMLVENISVMVVNGTGVAFNFGYTVVFFLHSGNQRGQTLGVIFVAVVIAATDYYVLINIMGWKASEAVGMSGAITGSLMYGFGAIVSMMAMNQNRGVGGFSAQAVASVANAAVWFGYAFFQNDLSMEISNGAGILCFVLQVVQLIYLHLKKPSEQQTGDINRRLLEEEA